MSGTKLIFLFAGTSAISNCTLKGCTPALPCLGTVDRCYDFTKNDCAARQFTWCDLCPPGKHIDVVEVGADNGSCDCNNYCGSSWNGEVKSRRPQWKGATCYQAFFTNATTKQTETIACNVQGVRIGATQQTCVCREAAFFCNKNPTNCDASCIPSGVPPAIENCVPDTSV
jgi:hypothetical protein